MRTAFSVRKSAVNQLRAASYPLPATSFALPASGFRHSTDPCSLETDN